MLKFILEATRIRLAKTILQKWKESLHQTLRLALQLQKSRQCGINRGRHIDQGNRTENGEINPHEYCLIPIKGANTIP